jgi:phosphatidylserine/phosphatidylglycerophosphate/cardiolipin synthase-like enzyme
MSNKHDAIFALNSSVVTVRGNVAYDKDENIVEYNEAAVQAYIDAHAYMENRAKEYPSIADQLDTLYHSGLDAWKAEIKTVKDKYPKP